MDKKVIDILEYKSKKLKNTLKSKDNNKYNEEEERIKTYNLFIKVLETMEKKM